MKLNSQKKYSQIIGNWSASQEETTPLVLATSGFIGLPKDRDSDKIGIKTGRCCLTRSYYHVSRWVMMVILYMLERFVSPSNGACYKLLCDCSAGCNPLLARFMIVSRLLPKKRSRVTLWLDGSQIHVRPDSMHGIRADMHWELLRRGVVLTRDGVYGVRPEMTIGYECDSDDDYIASRPYAERTYFLLDDDSVGMESDAIDDLETGSDDDGPDPSRGPVRSCFIVDDPGNLWMEHANRPDNSLVNVPSHLTEPDGSYYGSAAVICSLLALSITRLFYYDGLVPVLSIVWRSFRPFRCYTRLYREAIEMGPFPLVTDFVEWFDRNNLTPTDTCSMSYHFGLVHIAEGSIPTANILHDLRRGVVVTDGVEVQIHPRARIGADICAETIMPPVKQLCDVHDWFMGHYPLGVILVVILTRYYPGRPDWMVCLAVLMTGVKTVAFMHVLLFSWYVLMIMGIFVHAGPSKVLTPQSGVFEYNVGCIRNALPFEFDCPENLEDVTVRDLVGKASIWNALMTNMRECYLEPGVNGVHITNRRTRFRLTPALLRAVRDGATIVISDVEFNRNTVINGRVESAHLLGVCTIVFVTACLTVIGWLYLPIAFAMLLSCCIMLDEDATIKKVNLNVFGSEGDKRPMKMYYRQLQKLGLPMEWTDHTPGQIGSMMLGQIESGSYADAFVRALEAGVAMREQQLDDEIVLAPMNFIVWPFLTYTVTPGPDKVREFRLYKSGTFINQIADYCWRNRAPDIIIDSARGCCPRSADGVNPIVRRDNLHKRTTLVCLGSSSLEEPEGLDPETTWSTRPGKYNFEYRTNHSEFFMEYTDVYCHGGAGTVAIAKASGCNVISLDTLLDRDITSDAEYYFHDDTFLLFIQLLRAAGPAKARAMYDMVLPNLTVEQEFRCWRTLVIIHTGFLFRCTVVITYACGVFGVSSLLHGIPEAIRGVVTGAYFTNTQSLFIAQLLYLLAKEYARSHGVWNTVRTYYKQVFQAVRVHVRYAHNIIAQMLIQYFGFIWFILFLRTNPMWAWFLDIAPCIIRWIFNLWHAQEQAWSSAMADPTVVKICFQRLDAWWAHWLPLYHVEFYNPTTDQVVGVTCEEMHCVSYERKLRNAKSQFMLPCSLNVEQWDDIKSLTESCHGKPYHPISNCQTVTLDVLKDLNGSLSLQVMLIPLLLITVSVMTLVGATVMFPVTLMSAAGFATTGWLSVLMPQIAFAGLGNLGVKDAWELFLFVTSPTSILYDGPLVVDSWERYPRVKGTWEQFKPSSLRLMQVNVAGEAQSYLPPLRGVSRPEYADCRELGSSGIHNLVVERIQPASYEELGLKEMLCKELKDRCRKGKIALIATTRERPIQQRVLTWASQNCDQIIVLSNEEYPTMETIVVPTSGRQLACLRLCAPDIEGVTWVSLNAAYSDQAYKGLSKLSLTLHLIGKYDFVSVSSHGLHSSAAGLTSYKSDLSRSTVMEPYGVEEYWLTHKRGLVFIENNLIMFNAVRSNVDYALDAKIVLYSPKDLCDQGYFMITQWNIRNLVDGLANLMDVNCRTVGLTESGPVINSSPVALAPITSQLYPDGTRIETVLVDMQSNAGAFATRVDSWFRDMCDSAHDSPITRPMIDAYLSFNRAFSRLGRSRKSCWAPIMTELSKLRSEESDLLLHPNPVFVNADFDSTISHYIKSLNNYSQDQLSPGQFRRRVNRMPMIDTWLRDKLPDAYEEGIDASTLACREIMLASLARYNKGGFVDAMTDDDISRIVETIYRRNPDMLSDAVIADPFKLTKKFLSYKKYSAGIPFTGEGTGIQNRGDLRKAGWLKPIAELGSLPYKTGEWYPAIAHAFPKSQVVKLEKIRKNPAKMRSIVATAGFNNVQQGILNYDINNRHDFLGSHEKVAMPLTGAYMNHIFGDIAQYPHVYSLDVSDMDANLSNGVLRAIADLRKKGFEKHPAYDVICKHIDCAMEQTKHSYVINLIDDSMLDVEGFEGCEVFKKWQQPDMKVVEHRLAPGGVLDKRHGGSTGDSNVTFNNTKGLPIILMYSICNATDIKYEDFFDAVALHNFGDDDIVGCFLNPKTMEKVVNVAKEKLGITMRFESKGSTIFDQVFLGRRPVPASAFKHEFEQAKIPIPGYAIVNDASTVKMRLAREKAEMTRHKGNRHELYRLEKAMGYVQLCAHNRELYDIIVKYFDDVKRRLPETITSQKWFKKKFKLFSYEEVLRRWYKPINFEKMSGVHALQMRVGLLAKTERAFFRFCSLFSWIEQFPDHLVTPDQSANAIRTEYLYTGIFESHAWHTFVREHGDAPTIDELRNRVLQSPYHKFTNCDMWAQTIGRDLPTAGDLFERNANLSMIRVVLYTMVYFNVNKMSLALGAIPGGNILVELFNISIFKSRKFFGLLGYSNYVACGKSDPFIDSLAPKDPYVYHKRLAAIVMTVLPDLKVLGYIPTGQMARIVRACNNFCALHLNHSFVADDGIANTSASPWLEAATTALQLREAKEVPVIVAPTGTGKTRYTPTALLEIGGFDYLVLVLPRVIICEDMETKGYQHRHRYMTERQLKQLSCCTYGYLAHCYAHGTKWWPEDCKVLFLFDEAHEESIEWVYLRRNFIDKHSTVCMTATPDALTCQNFTTVPVKIDPPHRIETIESSLKLREACETYCRQANRFLVIEPSKRRAEALTEDLRASGYATKLVHSGDRIIPEGCHIVATSVIEAAITIPGCDVVIDTGERIVNNGGKLERVPNDIPGSIQRKGRTGRTNPGLYVQLVKPVNKVYPPMADVCMVLADHPIIKSLKYHVPFDRHKKIIADEYATTSEEVPCGAEISVALWHKIRQLDFSYVTQEEIYCRLQRGVGDTRADHLVLMCNVEGQLYPLRMVRQIYSKVDVHYTVKGRKVGRIIEWHENQLRAKCDPYNTAAGDRSIMAENHSGESRAKGPVRHRPRSHHGKKKQR